jgi:VWFA-related protein
MRPTSFASFVILAAGLAILPSALQAQDDRPTMRDRSGGSNQSDTPKLQDKTQGKAPEKATEVKAQPVVLAVTVRDKKGNLVPNLTAADFTLTQDGSEQKITSLSQQSDQPLLLGLEMDTGHTVESALNPARRAAQKFVETMFPADSEGTKASSLGFLIHFDSQVELLEDFTGSRDKLMRELEEMTPSARERNNPAGPETREDPGGWGQEERNRPTYGGSTLYDAVYLGSQELMLPKKGRKAIVLFGTGVDRSSKETQSEAIDSAERSDTVIYTVYFRGGEERNSGFGGANRTGGYPGGGYPGGGYPGGGGGYPGGGYPGQGRGSGREEKAPIDGKKVMQDIASRTGGEFYEAKKSDSLTDIYNQIATELKGQYVLVYTPDKADNEGGYHKIALTPKNGDLTVKTRTGYYAPGGENR